MKEVIINKRNLNALVRKTSFNYGGMFVSYGFIAVDFDVDKDNVARFYEATIASCNSWTNYSGVKIWNNENCAKVKKGDVLDEICNTIEETLNNSSDTYNIKFKFVNF